MWPFSASIWFKQSKCVLNIDSNGHQKKTKRTKKNKKNVLKQQTKTRRKKHVFYISPPSWPEIACSLELHTLLLTSCQNCSDAAEHLTNKWAHLSHWGTVIDVQSFSVHHHPHLLLLHWLANVQTKIRKVHSTKNTDTNPGRVCRRSSRNVACSAGASRVCRVPAASVAHERCPSAHRHSAEGSHCPAETGALLTAVQHPASRSFHPNEAPSPVAMMPPT